MSRRFLLLIFPLMALTTAHAQWQPQSSGTTANLRGIHGLSATIAWASGADGTVLHTIDGGAHWERCAVPPGGDKLDFRGIWAWDADVAVVMSAGPGDQSRLYRTTDDCRHWTEELANSDKDGFWDAVVFQLADWGYIGDLRTGMLIGDPVRGRFSTHFMAVGHGWFSDPDSCVARPSESAFAASNSSVFVFGNRRYILVTGGKGGPRALLSPLLVNALKGHVCVGVTLPLAGGADSAGAFSVSFRDPDHGVVVGGDYKKPGDSSGTAAWTSDGGHHWTAAAKPPHGYRSSVAWYEEARIWIAAGTNGSDISRDDGKTWQPLDDGNWNALSPPFAVGPNGRIGKLAPDRAKNAAAAEPRK